MLIHPQHWPGRVVPSSEQDVETAIESLCLRAGWPRADRRELRQVLSPWFEAGWCVDAVLRAVDPTPSGTLRLDRRETDEPHELLQKRLRAWLDDSGTAADRAAPPLPGMTLGRWWRIHRRNAETAAPRARGPLSEAGQQAREQTTAQARAFRRNPVDAVRQRQHRREEALDSLAPQGTRPPTSEDTRHPLRRRSTSRCVCGLVGRGKVVADDPAVRRAVAEILAQHGSPTPQSVVRLRGAVRAARARAELAALEAITTRTPDTDAPMSSEGRRVLDYMVRAVEEDLPVEPMIFLLNNDIDLRARRPPATSAEPAPAQPAPADATPPVPTGTPTTTPTADPAADPERAIRSETTASSWPSPGVEATTTVLHHPIGHPRQWRAALRPGGVREVLEPVDLEVKARPDAPDALVAFGRAYWRLDGTTLSGGPHWTEQAEAVAPVPGEPHHIAGAGVEATAPARYRCATCDGPLVLTAHGALADALAGRAVRCRTCTPTFELTVRLVLEAAGTEGVAAAGDPRRVALLRWFPVTCAPQEPLPAAGIRQELLVLGILRHGEGDRGRLLPLGRQPVPAAPRDLLPSWLSLARESGLLRVHPAGAPDAFTLPSPDEHHQTEAAGHSADDRDRPQVADPLLIGHYPPYGHDPEHAAATVEQHLTRRLLDATADVDTDSDDEHHRRACELRATTVQLLVHEALDYARNILPAAVPDDIATRIRDTLAAVLRTRTLGEACALLWRVRGTMYRHIPLAPGATPTARNLVDAEWWDIGIRRLTNEATAATRATHRIRPFTDLRYHSLSAATRTLADLTGVDPLRLRARPTRHGIGFSRAVTGGKAIRSS
ncbi:hypothetical protein [Saccharothrix deserti]|uniref:hypothetical protein n=1 Tax=Saccharothrix deserti TaxID=2593674 RepID=UPI00131B1DE9|nr:hypothetical protein [Saccharothrix deserti]